MAPDWPNTITSRHQHIRRRAEAYASALYYSECSLRGISPDDASAAAEHARSRQSRWWLKGNDPDHPTLQKAAVETNSSNDERVQQGNPNPEYVVEGSADSTDDEDDAAVEDIDDEELAEDDANVPILARDDDLGSNFGSLGSFCNSQNASRYVGSMTSTSIQASSSMVLPSWLSPQTSPEASPEVYKQAICMSSSEEVLNSYAAYPDLTKQEKQGSPSKPLAAAAQITSESEADDSIYSSGLSSDEATRFSRKPIHQGLDSTSRPRKRVTVDFSSLLDETYLDAQIDSTKAELLSRLANEGISPAFRTSLANLEKYSNLKSSCSNKRRRLSTSCVDAVDGTDIDGTWQMISPPEYLSCLGTNEDGDRLFTLGRMSFDMYPQPDLVCSIQKQFNTIKSVESTKDLPVYVPKNLRQEIDDERGGCSGNLKTYNIIASFTIENTATEEAESQDQVKKPLRGILTNYGYALSDPNHLGRKSVWFSGGTIEPADDDSLDEWMKVFGTSPGNTTTSGTTSTETAPAKSQHDLDAEKARSLASKIFLGAVSEPMDKNGTAGFHLHKPIGGHGRAYVDTIYMDDELRIMRGHSGSIYVFKRVA